MSEQSTYRDDIDLKALFRSILNTKGWVVAALLVVSAGFWAVEVVKNISAPVVQSYSTRINLVFKGVQDGKYPNGSPFSVNDIISPVVLSTVYDKDDMSRYISRQAFVNAFNIAPYTPDRKLILKKYAAQMDEGSLTPAEIATLQKQMNAELQNASRNSAEITFSGSKLRKIPHQLIDKVLRDVPREWAKHMVQDVGVARFNQEMYTEKVVNEKMFESMDYLIAFEMLKNRISMLDKNLKRIKALPNGLVVVDDKSGYSLPDLQKAISDLQQYRIEPLMNPVKALGIAKDPEAVKLYFENELATMKRDRDMLLQKKDDIENAYSMYVKNEYLNSGTTNSKAGSFSTGTMIPQFDAGFLNRLVQMTNSKQDIDYRQALNKKLLDESDQLADENSEIQRVDAILSGIDKSGHDTNKARQVYESKVSHELPVILAELKNYFEISDRMYDKLSVQELGSAGMMYRLADGNITYSQSHAVLTRANIRLYLMVCFLVVVIVVPAVMLRNVLRQ